MKKSILLLSFLFVSHSMRAQTAGSLDSSFNMNGKYTYDFGNNDNLNDVTLQPDQKIICTGVALSSGFTGVLKVLRLNTDGTPDSSFGVNGIFSYLTGQETYGYESYVRSDGKIIVAGISFDANYYADWMLLQLNTNGTLDSTFGNNGVTLVDFYGRDDFAQALTVQSDGRILISGTATDTINFYNIPTVGRFTANGIIDSTFGGNGFTQFPALYIDNELTSIVVQSDGKILAAGHFENTFTGSSDFDILVIRVDTNGFPDMNFGGGGFVLTSINGGIDDSFGMETDTAGNIVIAGFTTQPFTLTLNMVLVKYDANGNPDPGFGNSGILIYNDPIDNVANDLKIQPDNKIVVGGSYGSIFSGTQYIALWRYQSNGIIDSTFGNNGIVKTTVISGIQDCNSLTLQNDGKIVAAGKAYNGTNLDLSVLRYLVAGSATGTDIVSMAENELNIFPNPVNAGQRITLLFSEKIPGIKTFELVDVTGKCLLSKKNNSTIANDNSLQVQIPESISPGIYFLLTENGNQLYRQKVIVQ